MGTGTNPRNWSYLLDNKSIHRVATSLQCFPLGMKRLVLLSGCLVLYKTSFFKRISFSGPWLSLNNIVFPCWRSYSCFDIHQNLLPLFPVSLTCCLGKEKQLPSLGNVNLYLYFYFEAELSKFCHVVTHCNKGRGTPYNFGEEESGCQKKINWLT